MDVLCSLVDIVMYHILNAKLQLLIIRSFKFDKSFEILKHFNVQRITFF